MPDSVITYKSLYAPSARKKTHNAVAVADTFAMDSVSESQVVLGSNRLRSLYINVLVTSTASATATFKVRLYAWDELLQRYTKGTLIIDQSAVTLTLNSDSSLYEVAQAYRVDVAPQTCVLVLEEFSTSAGTKTFSMTVLPSLSY